MASQSAEYSQLQLLQYTFEKITGLQMLHIKCSTVNSRNASSVLYQPIPNNSWKKFRLLSTYMTKTEQPKFKKQTQGRETITRLGC